MRQRTDSNVGPSGIASKWSRENGDAHGTPSGRGPPARRARASQRRASRGGGGASPCIRVRALRPPFPRLSFRQAEIVARHGGRIWAAKVPGGGVVVTFTVPLEADIDARPEPRESPEPAGG